MIKLPNITLVCIDCLNYNSAIKAILKSVENIEFGKVLFLTDKRFINEKFNTVIIDKIKSKDEYSKFVLTELNSYIQTDFVLIIQYDGYVINPDLWDNEFLNYDYIGAPWWYDTENVGNGGFSLRSKKLIKLISEFSINWDESTWKKEDDYICRIMGKALKNNYSIRIAPEEIAAKFSFEPNGKYRTFANNTFGFHGVPKLIL